MEIEFKYKIENEEQAEAVFSDEEVLRFRDENSIEAINLHAIYFDTMDRRLTREGIAFRTRKEGENYVATMKYNDESENGLHVREEINVPISDVNTFNNPTPEVFKACSMYDKLLDLIGPRELLKRVEMKAVRKQVRIDTGKSIFELSYDQGKVYNSGKEGDISEMEIELYSGSREDMEEFAQKIEEKYGLTHENRSKFKQGLELNP